MPQITASLGFRRRVCDHDIGAAAPTEFPNQRAADKSAAAGNQDSPARPSVFSFATCHTVWFCAALLYSTGLFPEGLVKTARGPEHLRILLRRNAIERRVRQLGREITADFGGHRLHLIGVLRGASIFLSDLIREIGLEVSLDRIAVASYVQSIRRSGQARLSNDLDDSIVGAATI